MLRRWISGRVFMVFPCGVGVVSMMNTILGVHDDLFTYKILGRIYCLISNNETTQLTLPASPTLLSTFDHSSRENQRLYR